MRETVRRLAVANEVQPNRKELTIFSFALAVDDLSMPVNRLLKGHDCVFTAGQKQAAYFMATIPYTMAWCQPASYTLFASMASPSARHTRIHHYPSRRIHCSHSPSRQPRQGG